MLGAVVAMQACFKPDFSLNIPLGRIDATSANPTGRLPKHDVDSGEIKTLFMSKYGLTLAETVAFIGGGHSIVRKKSNDWV